MWFNFFCKWCLIRRSHLFPMWAFLINWLANLDGRLLPFLSASILLSCLNQRFQESPSHSCSPVVWFSSAPCLLNSFLITSANKNSFGLLVSPFDFVPKSVLCLKESLVLYWKILRVNYFFLICFATTYIIHFISKTA